MGRIAQTQTTKDGTLGTCMTKSDHVDAITTFLGSGTVPYGAMPHCQVARYIMTAHSSKLSRQLQVQVNNIHSFKSR